MVSRSESEKKKRKTNPQKNHLSSVDESERHYAMAFSNTFAGWTQTDTSMSRKIQNVFWKHDVQNSQRPIPPPLPPPTFSHGGSWGTQGNTA